MKEPDDRSRRCFLKASSMLGLAFAFRPATIGEAFADSKSNPAQKENTMAQTRQAARRCARIYGAAYSSFSKPGVEAMAADRFFAD